MRRTKIVVDMLERVKIKQISQDETEAVLEALLDKFADHGVQDIEDAKVLEEKLKQECRE